jgi:hypothetical protein
MKLTQIRVQWRVLISSGVESSRSDTVVLLLKCTLNTVAVQSRVCIFFESQFIVGLLVYPS